MHRLCRAPGAALVLLSAPAFADSRSKPAADCSIGAIPDTPVAGTVAGKPFVPKETTVHVTKDGAEMDAAKFDRYVLTIETDGIFNALSVDMLVPLNKKADGRVFPRAADRIPSATSRRRRHQGLPEVQGWDLQLETAGVDTSFTQEVASIRVEWGVRKANALPGKIHFCVPGQHAEDRRQFHGDLPLARRSANSLGTVTNCARAAARRSILAQPKRWCAA